MKLKNNPDSSHLSEAIKEYQIPAQHLEDGVRVPVSPVVLVDPTSDPARLVPTGWWILTGRHVLTSPVGGGILVQRMTMNTGQVCKLNSLTVFGPLSNTTLEGSVYDENAALTTSLFSLAAGVSRQWRGPSSGSLADVNAGRIWTNNYYFTPGTYLTLTAAASLATETLTLAYQLLSNMETHPTIAATGSVAGAVLGANTVSEANRTIKIDLPW